MKMKLLRTILGILACVVTGSSLAALLRFYCYTTNYWLSGVLSSVGIGVLLIFTVTAISPRREIETFLYLACYTIMIASMCFAIVSLIQFVAFLPVGIDWKAVVATIISVTMFCFTRRWVQHANLKPQEGPGAV
jgi:hypothetical protein